VPGWTSTLISVLLIGGVQLISLGLIGEYIGKIYEEVKRRPLYVIRERQGFGDDASSQTISTTEHPQHVGISSQL